jgi:glutaconate CoA-transferase, subunit B
MNATPFERFLFTASREFADGQVCFVGFHWPMVAARIARRLHAADLTVIYENGVVEDQLTPELATAPTDLRCAVGAPALMGSLDALYGWLRAGRAGLTVLDAPIVDQYGNVNTTVVGPYSAPKVRLAGSGGGTELGALGPGLTLLSSSTQPRSFPGRVDYITSPGHLYGAGQRARLGYPPDRGPKNMITPLGRFVLSPEGGFESFALHSGIVAAQVAEVFVGWPMPEEADAVLPDPQESDLKVIRAVLDDARHTRYRLPEGGPA